MKSFQQPMNSLLHHLKQKPLLGSKHAASFQRKKYNDMQYFREFTLLFVLFSSEKPTKKHVEISNFINMYNHFQKYLGH